MGFSGSCGFLGLCLALCVGSVACKGERDQPLKRTPKAPAPDRLLPDEALPGVERVFGLEVPQGLSISAQFSDVAQLTGIVPAEAVVKKLRDQVIVEHLELGTERTVFPRVFVKNDPRKRLFRIEVSSQRNRTDVRIRDITPPPVTQGLNESQRWEQAGRNSDGSLKDRLKVY
jgi:hypothetical protein